MQTLYEKDVMLCVRKVAMRSLARYEREHPKLFASLRFDKLMELRRNLLVKAFQPKVGVKMLHRLIKRGYEIVPGEGPERGTTCRLKSKFLNDLERTIAAASARLEDITWQ